MCCFEGLLATDSLQNCCQSGLGETLFSTSSTATKLFSLHAPHSTLDESLSSFLVPPSSFLVYANPVTLLSHNVTVASMSDACSDGRFVSLTI